MLWFGRPRTAWQQIIDYTTLDIWSNGSYQIVKGNKAIAISPHEYLKLKNTNIIQNIQIYSLILKNIYFSINYFLISPVLHLME